MATLILSRLWTLLWWRSDCNFLAALYEFLVLVSHVCLQSLDIGSIFVSARHLLLMVFLPVSSEVSDMSLEVIMSEFAPDSQCLYLHKYVLTTYQKTRQGSQKEPVARLHVNMLT